MIKSLFRALPPIAKRDRRIAELEAEILRQQNRARQKRRRVAEKPSFYASHWRQNYVYKYARRVGAKHPIYSVYPKQAAAQFARSHGLAVPEMLGEFDNFTNIQWQDLPDAFVIKPDYGSHSRGVLPLVRRGDKYLDLLDVAHGPKSAAEVISYLEDLVSRNKVSRRGRIEELVFSPHHDVDTVAPDVKLYCFYGEVGIIFVRTCNGSREDDNWTFRYFDASGNDLGAVPLDRRSDPTIPPPLHLDELVAAGSKLSLALKVPYVRLDFFEHKEGIVFGEMEPSPGGWQHLKRGLDRRLGQMWLDAEIRISEDLRRTGWLLPEFGPHDT